MKTFDAPFLTYKNDNTGIFEGHASIFNIVDLHNEKIVKGAFEKSLGTMKTMPPMLWQHDPMQPIGKWEKMYETPEGLYVVGRILQDIQKGQEAYTLIKNGIITGLSIGFVTKKSVRHRGVRFLEEIDLHEISLVTFPANPMARITTVKSKILGHLRALENTMQITMQI